MDNLVLIRVAASLATSLEGTILEDVRQEAAHSYRLSFRNAEGRTAPIILSLRPENPWVGRPARRFDGGPWSPSPFAVRLKKELRGLRIEGVAKLGPDRVVSFVFSGGRALIAELATHGGNVVLLDPEGRVEEAAHHPRSGQERLKPGTVYASPPMPPGKLVPHGVAPEAIDAFLAAKVREGEEPFEALRRHLFGVGSLGAALVLREAAASGRTAGQVLAVRLEELDEGRVDPVVEGPEDPTEAAERGPLDPGRFRLWPWAPRSVDPGHSLFRRDDAAGTAGVLHEAIERGAWVGARAEALRAILRQELRRAGDAERRARGDLGGFEDPGLWQRRGEALLAGLTTARRGRDHVLVPDPYDPEGGEIVIPAATGVPLTAVAEDCFKRHRRAQRGLDSARGRVEHLASRRARLEALAAAWEGPIANAAAVERDLGEALRNEGVAVGLTAGTRAQRHARAATLPRPEGLRMLASRDGMTILVGRTGRDNDRLTFKIAGPDDFWFHAKDHPGAHVVVRNPDRIGRPPAATLEDAAAAAAWYSEGRGEGALDVQWTRRKYVRRVRGAGAGRVVLKRFETTRVIPRPGPPGEKGD